MPYEKWPGGHIHRMRDGRPLYVIARTIRGERFHVSTRTHNLTAAAKQLERFESDPHGYSPAGVETEPPLVLTRQLILEHRRWSINSKGNTTRHANDVAHRLGEWGRVFGAKDLRRLTLRDDIRPSLDRWQTNRRHRIIALKSFYSWLRKERHLLTTAQDATLDLPVPQAQPEKAKRRKAVEPERIRAAWAQLKGRHADFLEVLAATGMHVSELERFVRNSEARLVRGARPLGVLVTRHKSGVWTRIPLSRREHVEAAERLKAGGTVPRWFRLHLRAACLQAGVEPFTPGVLRHSVATYAVEQGASPDAVAAFLHHRDKRTTERFYVDVASPRAQVPVLSLHGLSRKSASSESKSWSPSRRGRG